MKGIKEVLGGLASGAGASTLLGGLATGAAMGEFEGSHKKERKSNMDEAVKAEMERHKEGHKQRSEHGKY
jgi:hypothetical protein